MLEWGSEKPYFKPGRATLADVLAAPERLCAVGHQPNGVGVGISAVCLR
jgi:hypothetical protein